MIHKYDHAPEGGRETGMETDYVASFYTHLAAMRSLKALSALHAEGRLAPVPRALSASCGTALFFRADRDCREALDEDSEGLYERTPDGYRCLWKAKDA